MTWTQEQIDEAVKRMRESLDEGTDRILAIVKEETK